MGDADGSMSSLLTALITAMGEVNTTLGAGFRSVTDGLQSISGNALDTTSGTSRNRTPSRRRGRARHQDATSSASRRTVGAVGARYRRPGVLNPSAALGADRADNGRGLQRIYVPQFLAANATLQAFCAVPFVGSAYRTFLTQNATVVPAPPYPNDVDAFLALLGHLLGGEVRTPPCLSCQPATCNSAPHPGAPPTTGDRRPPRGAAVATMRLRQQLTSSLWWWMGGRLVSSQNNDDDGVVTRFTQALVHRAEDQDDPACVALNAKWTDLTVVHEEGTPRSPISAHSFLELAMLWLACVAIAGDTAPEAFRAFRTFATSVREAFIQPRLVYTRCGRHEAFAEGSVSEGSPGSQGSLGVEVPLSGDVSRVELLVLAGEVCGWQRAPASACPRTEPCTASCTVAQRECFALRAQRECFALLPAVLVLSPSRPSTDNTVSVRCPRELDGAVLALVRCWISFALWILLVSPYYYYYYRDVIERATM